MANTIEHQEKFEEGDLVNLRSNPSTKMVVDNFEDEDRIWCVWLDKNDVPQGKHFKSTSLTKSYTGEMPIA
jgi:hypothetical protein